jgi:glycerol kinase
VPDHAHCLVLDVGGQSLRAALLRRDGALLAMERREVVARYPQPGWVEHDPLALLSALKDAIAALLQRHRRAAHSLQSAGLSCQRASIVCWDRRSGVPLSPVISWQDARGAAILRAAGLDAEAVQACTGLRPSDFLGASKLAWCWRELPAVRAAAQSGRLGFGPLGSYLLHGLLVERPYLCPASLAQRSMLFDPARHAWDAALCAGFDIDPELLPEPSPDLAEFGLLPAYGHGIPLRLCCGDQNLLPAALRLAPDEVVVNLGTGAFLIAGGDAQAPRLQRSVLPSGSWPAALRLEGTVNGAASALDWWSQQCGGEAARPIPDSDLTTPHFLDSVGGLGSPLWRSGDKPRFSQPPSSPAQGRAAIADAVVHLLMLNLQAMRAVGLAGGRLFAGGGLAAADGLLQRLADLAATEVWRPLRSELSLSGAARLLGVAAAPGAARRFAPAAGAAAMRQRHAAWRSWVEEEIALSLE